MFCQAFILLITVISCDLVDLSSFSLQLRYIENIIFQSLLALTPLLAERDVIILSINASTADVTHDSLAYVWN